MDKIDIRLTGGAIIIGSLYWQDSLKDNDQKRKVWRTSSLFFDEEILVKLPIRYGRFSGNDKVYTMVFSLNCEKRNQLGTGYVIPFNKNPITHIDKILCEARKMSEVEGNNSKLVKGNKDKWGAICIRLNKKKLDNCSFALFMT